MSSHEYIPKALRNPLMKFPREHSCICGSGEMFKDCCLKYQQRAIPAEWAARITQVWDRLLSGSLRIVPPKEAKRAEEPDYNSKMPDVPVVPEEKERVLAGAADNVSDEPSIDGLHRPELGEASSGQP